MESPGDGFPKRPLEPSRGRQFAKRAERAETGVGLGVPTQDRPQVPARRVLPASVSGDAEGTVPPPLRLRAGLSALAQTLRRLPVVDLCHSCLALTPALDFDVDHQLPQV